MEVRDEILDNEMVKGKFNVCVTTYDALKIVGKRLHKYPWYLIAFDEAHKLKNSESITMGLARDLPNVRRLLLTGTPLQNNVGELWSLLNLLMPQVFKSKDDFNSWFNFDQSTRSQDDTADAPQLTQANKVMIVQILHRVMKPFMLRRTKKDLATQLPEKIEINISCALAPL